MINSMNKLMIAQVAFTKQQEDGTFKRVKEQYLIPGDTYSTAEEFVFTTLVDGIRGEVILDSLKREPVEDVIVFDDDIQESWYKCKVTMQDADSDKIKKISMIYYVNASSVASATKVLEDSLRESISDFEVKGVQVSPIVDVYVK